VQYWYLRYDVAYSRCSLKVLQGEGALKSTSSKEGIGSIPRTISLLKEEWNPVTCDDSGSAEPQIAMKTPLLERINVS